MQVIVDLHAAIGSQNGEEHSATIDGVSEWASGRDPDGKSYIELTLEVIEFLASRYSHTTRCNLHSGQYIDICMLVDLLKNL